MSLVAADPRLARLLCAALLLSACATPGPVVVTPSPTPEGGVLTVSALLDLSNERSPGGGAQRDALALWIERNASTGIPVRLDVVDVGGSEARLALELHRAVVERHADAVIVGTAAALTIFGFGALAEAARVPILLTLPAPEPSDLDGGRWIFALAPTHADLAAAALADAELRGVLEFSVYLALERDAADPERDAFEDELDRRAGRRVIGVRYEPSPDAQPLVAAYLALAPSAHVLARPRDHTPLADAIRASGTDALVYLSYLTDHAELGDLRAADIRSLWPSARRLVTPSAGSAGAGFVAAYAQRHGAPTAHAASAYDALSLLAEAAAAVGADDPALLRDRLERSTFAGVVTTYRFRADRHAGFDPADLAFVRWGGDAPVPAGLLR